MVSRPLDLTMPQRVPATRAERQERCGRQKTATLQTLHDTWQAAPQYSMRRHLGHRLSFTDAPVGAPQDQSGAPPRARQRWQRPGPDDAEDDAEDDDEEDEEDGAGGGRSAAAKAKGASTRRVAPAGRARVAAANVHPRRRRSGKASKQGTTYDGRSC